MRNGLKRVAEEGDADCFLGLALFLFVLTIGRVVCLIIEHRRDHPSVQIVRLINPSARDIAAAICSRGASEQVVKVIVPKHGEITRKFGIEGDGEIWVTYPKLGSRESVVSEAYYITSGMKTSITLRLDEGKAFGVKYD